jgi:hypothetical protein
MTPTGPKPGHRSLQPGRQGRATRLATTVLSAACLTLGLSACGNWISPPTVVGQVGLTVDAAGQPVIAVVTCSKQTPMIYMYEGRKKSDPGSKQNVQRGSWKARRGFSGVEKLDLAAPGVNWRTTSPSGSLQSDRLFLVDTGTAEDDHASLGGVDFRLGDLARLTPDQVQVNGKIRSWSAFGAFTCP